MIKGFLSQVSFIPQTFRTDQLQSLFHLNSQGTMHPLLSHEFFLLQQIQYSPWPDTHSDPVLRWCILVVLTRIRKL